MERVTYEKKDGTWGIKNVEWKDVPNELYGALSKLRDYERTGASPDEVKGYRESYGAKLTRVQELEDALYRSKSEGVLLKRILDEMRKSYGD